MQDSPYGDTGLKLPRIGLGALQIGDASLDETQAAAVLNTALDGGAVLIDTAPGYRLSEERIGRLISHRRSEFQLSTKLGYGVDGVPDWTYDCIVQGVDRALRLMRTDVLDIAHLHSCGREVLERGEVVAALEDVQRAGKVRAIAYSGDAHALECAIGLQRFDGFMCSLNPFDQKCIIDALPRMKGKGLIIKRALANHPWRFANQPHGDYCEEYWKRWKAMAPPDFGLSWGELSLRFALSFPEVNCAVIGTSKPANLLEAIGWAAKGPLPEGHIATLRALFEQHDQDWWGQV